LPFTWRQLRSNLAALTLDSNNADEEQNDNDDELPLEEEPVHEIATNYDDEEAEALSSDDDNDA
jgi:hypothetical protein